MCARDEDELYERQCEYGVCVSSVNIVRENR